MTTTGTYTGLLQVLTVPALAVLKGGVQGTLFTLPDPTAPVAGKTGRGHPGTSWSAASLVAPRAGTQRAEVIGALYRWHGSPAGLQRPGMTAAEIAPLIGCSRNQTATRLLELRESGWVEYVTAARFGPRVATEWTTQ